MSLHWIRSRFRGRRGSAVLEIALLAPLFGLVAAGAYDVGNAVQTSMRLERAARAGAQFALAQPGDPAGIRAAARAAWPDLSSLEVLVPVQQCRCGEEAVACGTLCPIDLHWTVTVTAQRAIDPLLLPWIGTRTGSATVRVR